MKAFVKMVSMLLVLLMVLSLCSCAEEPEETVNPSKSPVVTDSVESTGGTDELVITTQYLPEKVENPDDLPILKWVCLMETYYGGGNRTWTEDAVHEVNQMLAERNISFRVQFVLLTMNQFVWDMDWFSTFQTTDINAQLQSCCSHSGHILGIVLHNTFCCFPIGGRKIAVMN